MSEPSWGETLDLCTSIASHETVSTRSMFLKWCLHDELTMPAQPPWLFARLQGLVWKGLCSEFLGVEAAVLLVTFIIQNFFHHGVAHLMKLSTWNAVKADVRLQQPHLPIARTALSTINT